MAAPRVSIIMPAYNVAPYIGEALDSVFRQTFPDFEAIVVNDGSPDTEELERVLAPYLSRIIYLKQENRGLSGARNTALRVARGEFIALLDPDDIWEPNYLATHVRMLDDDPTATAVYPNAVFFGETRLAGRKYMDEFPSHGPVTFESVCSYQCHVMICVTARREAVLQAGMFDEALRKGGEDFDLWLRMLKRGGNFIYHSEVLARYRRRSDSLSADLPRMCSSKQQLLDKIENSFDLSPVEKKALTFSRKRARAYLDWYEGKQAFFRGHYEEARTKLRSANEHFQSRKLQLVLQVMRFSPYLLRTIYDWRDQYVMKADTKF